MRIVLLNCPHCGAELNRFKGHLSACPACAVPLTRVALLRFPALRALILADASVLMLLGVALIFRPQGVAQALDFRDLPASGDYLIGIMGGLFLTTGLGYLAALRDPLRNLIWIQLGIARGALEVLLGVVYISLGTVSWRQAGFGLIAAATIGAGYLFFYPHPPKLKRLEKD
jgi:hypothetical protein